MENITKREYEILKLLVQGYNNAEMAELLNIKEVTIETIFRNVFKKLGVTNRVQVVLKIFKEDLLQKNNELLKS